LRLAGIKKELKRYKAALVPADTGEIILLIDGAPKLSPETKDKRRIILNMNIGEDSLKEDIKREVNKLLSLGISKGAIRRTFQEAGVKPEPFISSERGKGNE
jgi:hypothetical protein